MKPTITLLILLSLTLSISACGHSNTTTSSISASASHPKRDRDNDGDNNDDDGKVLNYGHAANPTDKQAITIILERYYHAAAEQNGAQACSLLYPFVAESVAENGDDTSNQNKETCATAISKLFKQNHQRLAGQSATIKIIDTRVRGNKALAVLSFTTILAIRQFSLRRYHKTWKLLNVFDNLIE